METAIETNTNDEIQVLRLKLEMVEKELQFAIDRAERAEREVEQIKLLCRLNSGEGNAATKSSTRINYAEFFGDEPTNVRTHAPPPPPPPMPPFNLPPTNTSPHGSSLSDGIAFTLNSMRENNSDTNNQQVKPATGRYRLCSLPLPHQYVLLFFSCTDARSFARCGCCCCCYYWC